MLALIFAGLTGLVVYGSVKLIVLTLQILIQVKRAADGELK